MQDWVEQGGFTGPAAAFQFNASDFAYAFLSILLQGFPFILLGTIISGLLDQFLPAKQILNYLPKIGRFGIPIAATLGSLLPMCECAIVPVVRRLLRKGLPLPYGIAWLLASPVVNPIVFLCTFAAFRGQQPLAMATLRICLGFVVAITVAAICQNLPQNKILADRKSSNFHEFEIFPLETLGTKIAKALLLAVNDFFDVLTWFTLGAGAAALVGTAVNYLVVNSLAINDLLAVPAMMVMAFLLSLCSSSDAFIAATFASFSAGAKLSFLIFGPMVDLKLIFMYRMIFRAKFIAEITLAIFFLVGIVCLLVSWTLG